MTLPWPPSVNTYWRHPSRGALAGRHLISEAGRLYRSEICKLVLERGIHKNLGGSLAIKVLASPPDKRRRDLDNILKCLLDSLEHSGVVQDDCCFDDIQIVRKEPTKPGHVNVTIFQLEQL
jgi:crossover junction endodeoxyribonuclease RusA